MYTPHVVDPFIRQRLLGSFPHFGFCDYAAVKMDGHISVQVPGFSYFVYSQKGKCGLLWQFWNYPRKQILNFFSRTAILFFRGCHYFTFSEAMPTFSTSLQGLAIFYVLDIGYLKWFEVELHCGETGTIIIRIFFFFKMRR